MKSVRFACTLLTLVSVAAFAQNPPPPPDQAPPPPPAGQQAGPPPQMLSPDQLDNLVAPIALYPDPLMSQILVASTYPLEIVEASQWLQQNRNLKGQQLIDAARQQPWDPSIQALVVFPDVMARLTQDVRWTTDLGNAFLAQQEDVMNAVQRMRTRAKTNGKLQSTPQETVGEETQNGQAAITIQPTNPQVIYVPEYNPAWVWGPPVFGYYPPLFYPGIGIGFGWGPGIYIGSFFGGCCGWGGFGWGWGPNWFGGGIFVNNYFFHRYGFADGFHGGEFRGMSAWAHNPAHRMGVAYPNRALTARYGAANVRGGAAFNRGAAGNFNRGGAANANRGGENFNRGGENSNRGAAAERSGGQRFGSQQFERQNSGGNHSVFGGIHDGGQTRMQSDHGFSSMGHMGGGGMRGGGGRR